MAKITNILEGGSGKIGPVVMVKRYGEYYLRSKPSHFKDAKTPAQLAQRQRMKVTHSFLSQFKNLLAITFAKEATGRAPYQAAQSHTLKQGLEGEYPDIRINPQSALLSKGNLTLPSQAYYTREENGWLIEWDSAAAERGQADDTLLVIRQEIATGYGDYCFCGTKRYSGKFFWEHSNEGEKEKAYNLWIAFRSADEMEISDSMWIREKCR